MTLEENNKSFVIQNLTNQLVELERHFNNLEMNRSSETGRVASNRRAVYSNKTRSRYLTVRPSCYKFHIHLDI
jgi:nuclear pore complex protein Nup214